jgi:hypothetical protein
MMTTAKMLEFPVRWEWIILFQDESGELHEGVAKGYDAPDAFRNWDAARPGTAAVGATRFCVVGDMNNRKPCKLTGL